MCLSRVDKSVNRHVYALYVVWLPIRWYRLLWHIFLGTPSLTNIDKFIAQERGIYQSAELEWRRLVRALCQRRDRPNSVDIQPDTEGSKQAYQSSVIAIAKNDVSTSQNCCPDLYMYRFAPQHLWTPFVTPAQIRAFEASNRLYHAKTHKLD